MDENERLSLLALIVALLALIIALGQLLQQIFSTADGYRRCQHSVIGLWAKHTSLKWRWSQFRFETRFVTPDIRLDNGKLGAGYGDLLVSHKLEDPSTVPLRESAVSWTMLLHEIVHMEQKERSSKIPTLIYHSNTDSAEALTRMKHARIVVLQRTLSDPGT